MFSIYVSNIKGAAAGGLSDTRRLSRRKPPKCRFLCTFEQLKQKMPIAFLQLTIFKVVSYEEMFQSCAPLFLSRGKLEETKYTNWKREFLTRLKIVAMTTL